VKRRVLLRRYGSALATATALGVAGCSGDDSGGDDGEQEGDGGGTRTDEDGAPTETTVTSTTTTPTDETTTPTQDGDGGETTATTSRDLGDPIGGVKESSVDGLEILGLESKVAEGVPFPRSGEWGVKIELENTGGESTELTEYTWHLTVYDDGGDVLHEDDPTEANLIISPAGGRTLAAGETTEVALQPTDPIDPEKVGSYEVSLTCGTFADGVYCE